MRGCRAARSRTLRLLAGSRPFSTISARPAASARATTASRSASNELWCRCAWMSTNLFISARLPAMDVREQDNRIRWQPQSRSGHVESLFLKANDPHGQRAFWLKYTILARPGQPAEISLWAVAFDGE